MTHPIIIPNLGESITEVVLGEWLIQNGNWVDRDQSLLEIESIFKDSFIFGVITFSPAFVCC